MRVRLAAAPLVVALLTAAPAAQRPPAWTAAVDQVFADVSSTTSPGCAVGVFRDGRIAYERGYGMADLERDVAIQPSTVFYVGSVSKQFTAFAAALAASEGKLSLDDEVRRWIPELPDYGSRLTVRHLVHHTSGLRDYNTVFDIAGRRNDEAFDNHTVLRIVSRQKALNFAPGTDYLYSNSGYVLLSLVVERATGQTLADYAKTRIFQPLGMRDTQFYDDVTRLVKNRALAFDRTRDHWRDNTPHSQRTGAGGVLTSVRDLLAWDNNFYDPKVGTRALIEQLHQPGSLTSGKPMTYAFGLQVGEYRGHPSVEHGGSLGGYRAHLLRFPGARTSIATLCNFGTSNATARARRVADAVLAERFTQAAPAAAGAAAASRGDSGGVALTADQLRDLPGRYHSDEADATFVIDLAAGRLRLAREHDREPADLRPLGPDRFAFRSMTIRFLREDGRVTALAVDAGRVVDIRFRRVP